MQKTSQSLVVAALLSLSSFLPNLQASPSQPIALGAYYYDRGRLAPADQGAVASLRRQSGRLPAVFMIYQGWTGTYAPFPWREAKGAQKLGKPLMVSWEPWAGRNGDAAWSCAAVASGRYDGYLTRYAREARKFRGPIFMRLAHEMNGDWYPWATAYTSRSGRNNGNSPDSFTAMWRHVVSIFRHEGATNVAWVWSPNIFYMNGNNSQRDQIADLQALYPGDEWVDWVGLSAYNDGSRQPWRSFSQLMDGAYQTVTTISPRPLMIAELGVTEQGAPCGTSKAEWIEQTLKVDIPYRYPRVRMVTWFCRDKSDSGEANFRFDSSPRSLAAFRSAVNSPLYQGQIQLGVSRTRLASAR